MYTIKNTTIYKLKSFRLFTTHYTMHHTQILLWCSSSSLANTYTKQRIQIPRRITQKLPTRCPPHLHPVAFTHSLIASSHCLCWFNVSFQWCDLSVCLSKCVCVSVTCYAAWMILHDTVLLINVTITCTTLWFRGLATCLGGSLWTEKSILFTYLVEWIIQEQTTRPLNA